MFKLKLFKNSVSKANLYRMMSLEASNDKNILYHIKNNIGLIILNRPKQLNALNNQTIKKMHKILDDFNDDNKVKAILVKGSGDKAFCAGGDVKEVRETWLKEDKLQAMKNLHDENSLMYKVSVCKKPYIAFINGITMGSGAGKYLFYILTTLIIK